MNTIQPCLWFDHQAEEAASFYVSIFRNSKITAVSRYGEAGAQASGRPKGSVMTVAFELDGQPFVALNGGPIFKFTEAISLMVNCRDQKEVDAFWEKLSKGGEEGPCGWLKDKFGLSWQVVPTALPKMLQDKDPEKTERVMAAMLQMKKIDVAGLKRAYASRADFADLRSAKKASAAHREKPIPRETARKRLRLGRRKAESRPRVARRRVGARR
jgi:predicted 3-demethylubiquinone-9 3-methyltransferase (glyoxalase superfamily)